MDFLDNTPIQKYVVTFSDGTKVQFKSTKAIKEYQKSTQLKIDRVWIDTRSSNEIN